MPGTVNDSGFAINCAFIISVREWYVYTKNTSKTAVIKNCFLGDKRMIEIYDLNDKLITRVSNQDQLDEFMDDNEFEYPEVIIKENGKKRKYTFEDSEFESAKRELLKKSKYFHMSRICALANVDYYSFNLWKNKGIFVLTPKEIDALYDAISHVCK